MSSLKKALRGVFGLGRDSASRTAAPKPALPLPSFPDPKTDPGLIEAGRLIAEGKLAAAFAGLNQLKAKRVPLLNADYLRAIYFTKENQFDSAVEALKEELRYFPDNPLAIAALKTLLADRPSTGSSDEEFQALLQVIWPYTMVGEGRLLSLFTLAKQVCQEDLPGHFVECGVAAGGSSALLATIISRQSKRPRQLFSFDSFEGMPTPSDQDTYRGQRAEATGWGTGTCAAPVESLREVCRKLGVEALVEPVRGFFDQTLPVNRKRIGPIAFLHVDGDWYESTQQILGNLYDQVVPGGRIQIDDYGHWEGCRRAVEEFQKELKIEFKLHPIDGTGVWMEKPRPANESGTLSPPTGRTEPAKLLNVGCGTRFHAAWANLDIVPAGGRVGVDVGADHAMDLQIMARCDRPRLGIRSKRDGERRGASAPDGVEDRDRARGVPPAHRHRRKPSGPLHGGKAGLAGRHCRGDAGDGHRAERDRRTVGDGASDTPLHDCLDIVGADQILPAAHHRILKCDIGQPPARPRDHIGLGFSRRLGGITHRCHPAVQHARGAIPEDDLVAVRPCRRGGSGRARAHRERKLVDSPVDQRTLAGRETPRRQRALVGGRHVLDLPVRHGQEEERERIDAI